MRALPRAFAGTALGLACVLGCGPEDSLYPLALGREWTYEVRSGFQVRVEEFRVARRLSVAGHEGFEIASGYGRARLAWAGPVLLAQSLPGASFDPPMPILRSEGEGSWRWSGTVRFSDKAFRGRAELRQTRETETIAGKKETVAQVAMRLETDTGISECVSRYVPGRGLYRQTQHTNRYQDLSLKLVSGP